MRMNESANNKEVQCDRESVFNWSLIKKKKKKEGGEGKVKPAKLLYHCGITMESLFEWEAHPPCL